MPTHKFAFKLLNYGSWHEDADYNRVKSAWKQVASILSSVEYDTRHGLINIYVDWEPAINRLTPPLHVSEAQVQAIVKIANANLKKEASKNLARQYLEVFFCESFLAVNIAVPGTYNFYNTEIISSRKWYSTKINLDSYAIESAIEFSKQIGWPVIKDIEVDVVYNWLKVLKIGITQVARSRIERVLIAFLNALHGNISITSILWLSHALEAFYDTPSIEVVKHFRNRAFKWLALPEHNKKAIKKEFDNFYSIRSAYAHGTFEITHTLCNEVIDKDVAVQMSKIYHANNFGLATLIASIQMLIENNCYDLDFEEIIHCK
jgi:hypothetical protein